MQSRSRSIKAIAGTIAALAALAATGAVSASAADNVGGYSYGEAAFNAPDGRLSGGSLTCPGGKPVVGGGVDSSGGLNDFMTIYSSGPFDGPDGDTLQDDGWSGLVDRSDFGSESRTVRIYAICDTLKTTASYSYNRKSVSVGDGKQVTLTVPCPNGLPVVGGGVASSGGYSERMGVHSSGPYDGSDANTAQDDGWRASVANVTTSGFPRGATAYAICDKSRPQSAYSYVKKTASVAENQQLRTDVLCAAASHVVGGGLAATGGYDDKVFVNTSRPLDAADADAAEDDGWRAAIDNTEGIVSDHTANPVTLYAICRR